ILILFCIISIFESNISQVKPKKEKKNINDTDYKRVLYILIALILWVYFVPILGFILCTFLFTISVMIIMGNRKIYQLILVPLLLSTIIYYTFNNLLNVFLP